MQLEPPTVMSRFPAKVWLTAAALFAVLALSGGRYGFHRDELYFIEGGRHLAWAQPDNPMLVPLLAAGWYEMVGGRLWAFRLLPAVTAALVVPVGAATSRLLGGSSREQAVTGAVVAVTAIVVGTGHLFSTTTFDLALTALVLMLLIRALRQDPQRLLPWLLTGLAAGIDLEVKLLVALVLGCCLLGLLIAGPHKPLAGPGPWLAAAVAALLAAPNLIWQAAHSWPMIDIAASIAAGGSVSSADRATVVPLHLLMAGVAAGIVLVTGLVSLLRRPQLRRWRWLAVGYLLMLILVVVTGGKPYYLAGFFPAVIAAGVGPLTGWIERTQLRRRAAVVALVVLSIPTAFISLPLAPVGSPVYQVAVTVNPDVAETVGWDGFLDTIRRVAERVPPDQRQQTIVLTSNYGEAGAISRELRRPKAAGTGSWLPDVYSGYNGYGEWGPPPGHVQTAIVVGRFSDEHLASWFDECTTEATVVSPTGVDNEESGAPVRICRLGGHDLAASWPAIRRLG